MVRSNILTVRSHVARDLLQTSALFKSDRAVVWEYVSNGLDYVDDGVLPSVHVVIDVSAKRIVITDNGRGMDWVGLSNYFTMHGENVDRRSGQHKRGLFGTGKSAAFAIAELLRISTVREGKRSVVQLSRASIKKVSSEAPVPIEVLAREEACELGNGTEISIEGIRLKLIDSAGIVQHIQQQLAHFSTPVRVFVNHREVEYQEPVAIDMQKFPPSEEQARTLGDVLLTIKVAAAPLDETLRGISIFSHGVLHDRTLAGLHGKEMSQYLFGSIDVPQLDAEADSDIPAFDMSRSLKLNIENHLVRVLYAFLGQKLDLVRRQLVESERQRKSTAEAKRMAREAFEIARYINEDFREFRQKVGRMRTSASTGFDYSGLQHSSEPSELVLPGQSTGASEGAEAATGSDGSAHSKGGTEPRNLAKSLRHDPTAERVGSPASSNPNQRNSAGGFGVKFDHMGEAEMRAKYLRDERTIYINLDHPQLVAARDGQNSDDPLFRQLSYEIAFSEYAVALASELNNQGEYIEPSDPIVDIRNSINRLSRRAARLFAR
jgi:hypothetical protein